MKYYLAGPMTGRPQFNFPLFDSVAAELRSQGFDIVSPAELDDPESREAALANEDGNPAKYQRDTGETWGDLLARDVKLIAEECDGIVVLPEWSTSRGARLEVFVALTTNKPVYQPTYNLSALQNIAPAVLMTDIACGMGL